MLFDGTPIGTFSPGGTSYTTFTTNNFMATAGANTLTFVGLNPNGGDNTAFIDEVVTRHRQQRSRWGLREP